MWYWIRTGRGAGPALSGARRRRGITQEELARRLKVNRTTIINLEAGRTPAVNRLIDALNLLGYDLIAVPRTANVRVVEPTEETR